MSFLLEDEAYLLLKALQDALSKHVTSFGEVHPYIKRPKVLEFEENAFVFIDGEFLEKTLVRE